MLDEEKVKQRDIFHYGMRFVVDGSDKDFLEKILSNIINLETDNEIKILKTLQKEAVLGIQTGMNSYYLIELLNSYVDLLITYRRS